MKIIPREGGGYTVMTNTGWHLSKEVVVAAGACRVSFSAR
jgi:hypothetical protein